MMSTLGDTQLDWDFSDQPLGSYDYGVQYHIWYGKSLYIHKLMIPIELLVKLQN